MPYEDEEVDDSKAEAAIVELCEKHDEGVASMRAVSGPAAAPAGPAPLATIRDDFILEALDKKHRRADYLKALRKTYDDLPQATRMLQDFYAWVDNLTVHAFKSSLERHHEHKDKLPKKLQDWWEELPKFQKGVKYAVDENQRWKYRLRVQSGRLMRRGEVRELAGPGEASRLRWFDTLRDVPYSTTMVKSRWSGDGWGIWVLSQEGNFYSSRMKVHRLHHSSFLGGAPVKAAGEWRVEGGVLKSITACSGHYKPQLLQLREALIDLDRMHLTDFDKVEVRVFSIGGYQGSPMIYPPAKFLMMSQAQLAHLRPSPCMQ